MKKQMMCIGQTVKFAEIFAGDRYYHSGRIIQITNGRAQVEYVCFMTGIKRIATFSARALKDCES